METFKTVGIPGKETDVEKKEIKHRENLKRALASSNGAEALRNFPVASLVHPDRLLQFIEESDPRMAPCTRNYHDGMAIKDLVYTLMEEWGWTKEEREG